MRKVQHNKLADCGCRRDTCEIFRVKLRRDSRQLSFEHFVKLLSFVLLHINWLGIGVDRIQLFVDASLDAGKVDSGLEGIEVYFVTTLGYKVDKAVAQRGGWNRNVMVTFLL